MRRVHFIKYVYSIMHMSYRNAFLSASKRFVEKDLEVSVAGHVFMITGANSGIGRATAMAIAKRGNKPNACFPASWFKHDDKHVS